VTLVNAQELCEIFTLSCKGVQFEVDINQTCVAQDYPSLKTDFIESLYVVSKKDDYNENLETKFDNNEMFENCKPKKLNDEDVFKFKFTVDECILNDDNDLDHHVDDSDNKLIKYTYYIKHQRLVGNVAISAMSPKPISCQIESTVSVTADTDIRDEEVEKSSVQTAINPATVMKLAVVNTNETSDQFEVGDMGRLSIEVDSETEGLDATAFKNEFKYAFKNCIAIGGSNKVNFIDDYCPATVFTGMIKSDDNGNYDNVGEFNSFQFNVFKFPDVDTVSFECTITVCHEETDFDQCFLDNDGNPANASCGGADIWTKSETPSTRRKRRSSENDQRDFKLTATLNFQPKSSNNSATLMAGGLFAAFMLLL